MKVGYIITEKAPLSFPIGYSVHTRSFICSFAKIGGEIFLLKKGIKKDKLKGIEMHNIKWIEGPWKLQKLCDLFFNLRLYLTAQSIIREKKPDILHERESYLNFSGLLLANRFKIPYVLEVNCPMMYEMRNSFPVYKKIHKRIEKKLYSRADKIITVSEALKNYLINQRVSKEKIKVIPNGVDREIFKPGISGQKVRSKYGLERKDIIVFAGSLHQEWQGIDDLLKSAQKISSIRPSIRFLVAGGSSEEVKNLKEYAPSNVIFAGRVAHSKVPEYLAAADILVAPYKKEKDLNKISFYNSPIKLFEYMAMGKPIITSNIGQIKEILKHRETGLLIEPGNHRDLLKNILFLIEDDYLKRKLGYNARVEVEKNYTWEQNVRRVMKVYKEALEDKSLPK